MAKAFSVASWNVEHFGATSSGASAPRKPVGPILEFLAAQGADVVAIYEVVGKVVYSEIVTRMPGYQFHITEGPQSQEILVGVKKNLTSFFTQKLEFKSGDSYLRPGALLTIHKDGQDYPLLFLHLKSLPSPRDISAEEELERLRKRLNHRSVAMEILAKSAPGTWWPGSGSSYPVSDLDHVVAAEHLSFRSFGGASVDVRGWVDEPTDAKKDAWAKKYSDHALLYFELQAP